jgi:uncharacterized membrane protein YidH (DUF202 family)
MRDLLASNRTLLAWIRTSLGFAGLGFAVAKFGLESSLTRLSGYVGLVLVLVALLLTMAGFAQHRSTVAQEKIPPGAPRPAGWPALAAVACCLLTCALLAAYLALSLT